MPVSSAPTAPSTPPRRPPPGAAPGVARREILRGATLTVADYRCRAAPLDRPFAEQHERHCIAYVRRGAFGCRCRGRAFELVPGSLFVGSPGDEYTCTHEHHLGGDECLSFAFAPALVDAVGDAASAWQVGALPPLPALVVLGELAQAAADGRSNVGLDEVGLLLARRLVELVGGRPRRALAASAADRQRAVRSALWIEANAREAIDLDAAAAVAGLGSFHFLRVFGRVFGLTPHQYLIRQRLRLAARLLAEETMSITEVAFEVGFGDLSNFVRSFGQAAGLPPSGFRRLARGERRLLQDRLVVAAHS